MQSPEPIVPILELDDLVKHYRVKGGTVHALSGVSLAVASGETLGIVGESGCGKSTMARLIMGFSEPTEGRVLIDGKDVGTLPSREKRRMRTHVQMVFQDPFTSLNPRAKVGRIIGEPLLVAGHPRAEVADRVGAMMERVGLHPEAAERYPHEFSGGQRQRIGIARGLILGSKLLICDEPVSALDVSVRAQILNLFAELQEALDVSYLFISHDLAVVAHVSDRVAVMYLGTIVESAPRLSLFSTPLHPYTRALLAAVPNPDPRQRDSRPVSIKGDVPSPLAPPPGCRFHTRCPWATDICRKELPVLRELGADHFVACHLAPLPEGAESKRRLMAVA
jgi:oligopeptide/dipeptide ABC transporter ATP-binding protein